MSEGLQVSKKRVPLQMTKRIDRLNQSFFSFIILMYMRTLVNTPSNNQQK